MLIQVTTMSSPGNSLQRVPSISPAYSPMFKLTGATAPCTLCLVFTEGYRRPQHIPIRRNYMSLQEKIKGELKVAMKAKDTAKTGAIRILIGEFQRQPEKELADDAVIGIIKKLIKSEREVIAAGGQGDDAYIAVLEEYLPKQASEEDIRTWVAANVDFAQFANKMQAMKPIMAHFGSNADGNIVKKVLQDM